MGGFYSDRLYYTGKNLIETYLKPFTKWLSHINQHLKVCNFPFHAEVRMNNDLITPIEFNPLRFARRKRR